MAELRQPRPLAKLENLREQAGERLQMALAEVGHGAKIRRIEPDEAHEVDPLARSLRDPARRVDAVAIAVQQKRRHHRRVERRLPALARVSRLDLAKVDVAIKHQRGFIEGQLTQAHETEIAKLTRAHRQLLEHLLQRSGPPPQANEGELGREITARRSVSCRRIRTRME